MKNKILLISMLCFMLSSSCIYAQSYLYSEIEHAKKSKIKFEKKTPFLILPKDQKRINVFKNKDKIVFLKYNPIQFKDNNKAICISVPLNGTEKTLDLLRLENCYNYKVTTNRGTYKTSRAIKHYKGIVRGMPNSSVTLTFFENKVMGIIVTDKGNFNLVFDKSTQNHILYNDRNLIQSNPFECFTKSKNTIPYSEEILFPKENAKDDEEDSETLHIKTVKLYFETSFSTYQFYNNNISEVEAFVTGLYNQIATLYRNENILTELSEIKIWISPDPYTAMDEGVLLSQFQNETTSINGDLGQLIVFQKGGGGVSACIGGLCDTSVEYKLSVCKIDENVESFPIYSWSVENTTHEFGHLLGSHHTHACVWNGDGTAIDGCDDPEGQCPPGPMPGEDQGTIMSYCHRTVGIGFNMGFGPQPGNVIRNAVNKATCLSSYELKLSGVDTICNQATYIIENIPPSFPVIWNTTNNNLVLASGQGTGSAVFNVVRGGYCKISANVLGTTKLLQKEVVVNRTPEASEIDVYTNKQLSEGLPQDFLLANFNYDFVSCYQDDAPTLYASVPNILGASSIFAISPENNNSTPPMSYEWRIKSGNQYWLIDPIIANSNTGVTFTPNSFVFVTCNPAMIYPVFQLPPPPVIEVRVQSLCGISEWKEVSGFNVKNCDDYGAYHVLTPNGDGVNDIFEINIPEKTTKKTSSSVTFKLTILNEKGEVVYQKNSYMKDRERFKGVGNKGKSRAVCLPAGIYSYAFEGYKKQWGHIYIQRNQ